MLEDPPRGPAEVAKPVVAAGSPPLAGAIDLDVELEHQATRRHRGGLRLVLVRALGERQQLADPGDDPTGTIILGRLLWGRHRRPAVDPEQLTDPTKGRTVRVLVDAHPLVDELVRDLVLEHLDDLDPGPLEHQRPRDLDAAQLAVPLPEPGAGLRELEDRPAQTLPEVGVVDRVPLKRQPLEQLRFEFGAQLSCDVRGTDAHRREGIASPPGRKNLAARRARR